MSLNIQEILAVGRIWVMLMPVVL